jgi:ABC-type transporter Mla subunit MlaD
MDIAQLLHSILEIIDSTDPESDEFLDSGADSLDKLLELEDEIRDAIETLTGRYPKEEYQI